MSADPTAGMPCVEVTGSPRNTGGYGQVGVPCGRGWRPAILAHRLAYERTWGVTLKPGQVVRHTCDNPACVNPLHLQVGTPADNNRDRDQRGRTYNGRAARTHCPQGHSLEDPENLDRWHLARGVRKCRECNRLRMIEQRRRVASRG